MTDRLWLFVFLVLSTSCQQGEVSGIFGEGSGTQVITDTCDGGVVLDSGTNDPSASASEILTGRECWDEDGQLVSGTMSSRGVFDLNSAFPGSGYFSAAANSPSGATICNGTTILGVNGSGTCISNSSPVAVNDSASVAEDSSTTVAVLGNDTDADADTLVVCGLTAPTQGTALLQPNGSIKYAPTANYNGADSFTYTVCDDNGASSIGTVSMTVTAVNDAPVITSSSTTANHNVGKSIDLLSTAADADGGTPTLLSSILQFNNSGTLVNNGGGLVTYTWTSAATAQVYQTENILYTVADSAASFSTDFSSSPSGATIQGSGAVVGSGYLQMTNTTGQWGVITIDDLTAGAGVSNFYLSFDLYIWGGNAADGCWFYLGDSSSWDYSGLKIEFDTYDNAAGQNPVDQADAIEVYYKGAQLARYSSAGLRSASWQTVVIRYSNNAGLSVFHNNKLKIAGVKLPHYVVDPNARFRIYCNTGGAWDIHRIDNLTIYANNTDTGVYNIRVSP